MRARPGLTELARQREIYAILLEHALRGLRIQVLLRWVLVAFVGLVLLAEPPADDVACWVVLAAYAAGAIGFAVAIRGRTEAAARFAWLALFGDLVAMATVTVLAGRSEQTWTADILVNGLFLVPLLAATQLRPLVCAAVAAPTVVVYVVAAAAARLTHLEPWASVLLRSFALGGLAVGCVLLSRVQRSRVVDIGGLAADRSQLLAETMQIEERERRDLAEHLHDGVLQYLLAARQDLDEARSTDDPASLDRVEQALHRSSTLLRSTMGELHPAVLEQSGLAVAVERLTRTIGARGRFGIRLDTGGWPDDLRTPADAVLFAAARELLTNVTKHAHAHHVDVVLARDDGTVRLTITDDGTGIAPGLAAERLGEGHLGLASHRARVEALGGLLLLQNADPHGTTASVAVPLAGS